VGPNVWADVEFLLLWVKQAPVPSPLVNSFTPNGLAATTGLGGGFGVNVPSGPFPSRIDFGTFMGGQLRVGGWLDECRGIGLEGSGFLTEDRSGGTALPADPRQIAGRPVIAAPPPRVVPRLVAPAAIGLLTPPPGTTFSVTGGQAVNSSLRLWGADAHGLYRILNSDGFSLSALAGFRYLDVQEQLTIYDRETANGFGTFVATDSFGTRNQFYGGQLGARAEARMGWFFASAMGAVSLGTTRESVTVNGVSTFTPTTGAGAASPNGIFAQQSNSGRRVRDEFAVAPEAHIRLGASLTRSVCVFAGYDLFFISDVARPGDQIDRGANGNAKPLPLFNRTEFWAQGLSLGMELSY
jgi:hypothetical protein